MLLLIAVSLDSTGNGTWYGYRASSNELGSKGAQRKKDPVHAG